MSLIGSNYLFYLIIFFLVIGLFGFWAWRQGDQKFSKLSLLSLYSKDLTQLAEEGKIDPVIGRHHEIKRVIQILCRRTKNNPVLIGKSGVGKTAIVEELATEIATGNVPDVLKGKKVLALDLSGLVAGTKYRGEFEKRLKAIVDEIVAAQRNIILFIDELHTLAEAGEAEGAIDASDILKPALARGQLQAVGATTEKDYKEFIVKDPTLERRFQPIVVAEPSTQETVKILKGIRSRYEDYHQVIISSEAIEKAVSLSNKYLSDRHFPDKAIDLIDEASSKVHLDTITAPQKFQGQEIPVVKGPDVEEVFKDWLKESEIIK